MLVPFHCTNHTRHTALLYNGQPLHVLSEEKAVSSAQRPQEGHQILYPFCVVGKRAVTAGNILEEFGYKEFVKAGFKKANEKRRQ